MLKIACLPDNTQLVQDLQDIVEFIAYDRAGSNRPSGVMDVYNDIRNSGIEIDLKSIAYIYADKLPLDEAAFDTLDEIDELTGRNFAGMLKNIINLAPRTENNEIAELSSEEWVATRIAEAFYGAHTEKVVNKSDMVVMQNALLNGAKRLLGKLPKDPTTKENWKDIIAEVLKVDNMGVINLSGQLNSIRDLFGAMQEELARYSKEIGRASDPALQEKWENYAREIESAAYNLLFSKKDAKKVLTDIMKEGGFGKKVGNRTIIDWNKMAGEIGDVTKLKENASTVLNNAGFRPDVVDQVVNALQTEFNDMFAESMMKADKELSAREARLGKTPAETKKQYQRLAELNNLGIFKGAHDKLLYSMLGVDGLTAADLAALTDLAQNIADLGREMNGQDYAASYAYQQFQHKINLIVSRNASNKSRLLKLMSVVDKYFQVLNAGRIANPFNSTQNNWSGFKEMIAVSGLIRKDLGIKFLKDHNLFAAVWKDVATGGIKHGSDNVVFSHRENLEEQLSDNHKTIMKKLAHAILTPARAFLSASDSAFKAVIQKKLMMLGMYKALTQTGMNEEDAARTINEALYGQSWEEAKTRAEGILKKYNLPVNNNSIIRLANDLVAANLNLGELINDDLISAAKSSAYHVAGIGLGHIPNNKISSSIESIKKDSAQKEARMAKEGLNADLAWHRLSDSLFHGAFIPFMGGVFNWVVLTAQSDFGVGILTGGMDKDFTNKIDFKSKQAIRSSLDANMRARTAVARGITGLVFGAVITALLYGIANAIFKKKKKPNGDDLSPMQQMEDHIRSNYLLNRFMLRVSPSPLILQYSIATAKTPLVGSLQWGTNFFNIGNQFDKTLEVGDALRLASTGKPDEAKGKLGSVFGQMAEVPFWRSYKGYYQLEQGIAGKDVKSDFKKPHTFADGLFMGGFLQDAGFYHPYQGVEVLKGIGDKKAAILRAKGINTVGDLKKSNWQGILDENENPIFHTKDIETISDDLKAYP